MGEERVLSEKILNSTMEFLFLVFVRVAASLGLPPMM
jgi:hypothetical protein